MSRRLVRFVLPFMLPWLLCTAGCDAGPQARAPVSIAPRPAVLAAQAPAPAPTSSSSAAAPAVEQAASTRGEVVLVELGRPFPPDLVDAIEQALRDELQVEVVRHERIPLPKDAYYAKRKRYRADILLDHLLTLATDAPPTTRVLGLTTVDISTTKGKHYDWGIFGLGLVPGQAAVISSHRLERGAKDREHLRFRVSNTAVHEVGHTFGLEHCPEALCPMQDAQGGIANTDSSTGHLGPGCRAKLDAGFPRR